MTVLIRNGLVLSARGLVPADVLVDAGAVSRIEDELRMDADEVLDARGCLVGPGFVDIHTHLRDPGQTWKEDLHSGTASAVAGGFTAVVAMPNTEPPIDDPKIVRDIRARADEIGLVEVTVAGALTRSRAGASEADVEALYDAGVRLFTDDGDAVEDDGILSGLMERLAALPGAVVAQHAEMSSLTEGGHIHDGKVSRSLGVGGLPAAAEEAIVERDLGLVAETLVRYHCQHVSSAGTVELIREAKTRGLGVTAEVTPHHLSFDEDDARTLDPNFKMYPPLRTAGDRHALRSALLDGTIDVVASDHAPHTLEEKQSGFLEAPRGVIGLETAAAVTWEMVDDPEVLFDRLSIGPARIAGLGSQGRRLAIGSPANIVVFDPRRRWVANEFRSKADNSPYIGMEMTGRVVATMFRGQLVNRLEREHA